MPGAAQSSRDPRIDVLRGLALMMLFVDHVPDDVLGFVTMHMYGFADAAELFVILAGFSSQFAYGGLFERAGVGVGLRKVMARCARLYIFQVALLLLTLAIVREWNARYGILIPELIPFLSGGAAMVKHGMMLSALPAKLDILPLYMLLMALFPAIHVAMRFSVVGTVGLSAAVWLGANLDHDLNLRNWVDGAGWYFNPFAWQLLFVLGAAGARLMRSYGGSLPRIPWLAAACWMYLGFALVASAPWVSWHLSVWPPILMATPDKSSLAPLRVLDIMALIYLALSSPRFLAATRRPWAAALDVCGRHSLEVFSTATLLSLVGGLLTTTFGAGPLMQIGVNLVGFAAMIGVAKALEHRKRKKGRAAPPAPHPARPISPATR